MPFFFSCSVGCFFWPVYTLACTDPTIGGVCTDSERDDSLNLFPMSTLVFMNPTSSL